MLIITISLPLYSKVLWEKVPQVIPIRMTNDGYIKKAFQKGNSKLWTQTTHERNFLDSQGLGGLCYPTHSPLSVATGSGKNSTIKWYILLLRPSAPAILASFLFLECFHLSTFALNHLAVWNTSITSPYGFLPDSLEVFIQMALSLWRLPWAPCILFCITAPSSVLPIPLALSFLHSTYYHSIYYLLIFRFFVFPSWI